jgi:crossover junction endodeoxyribonuclease RuvC
MAEDRIILGIDPGTIIMGYGILTIKDRNPQLEAMGVLHLNKYDDHYLRLLRIHERILSLINEYHPAELAIEAPFYGKNVQSMLKLGRAQGVAMAAALSRGLPVYEYAPRRIKQSITGRGGASKIQVAALLKSILQIEYSVQRLDATDGLAVALCHHFTSASPLAETKRANPLKRRRYFSRQGKAKDSDCP